MTRHKLVGCVGNRFRRHQHRADFFGKARKRTGRIILKPVSQLPDNVFSRRLLFASIQHLANRIEFRRAPFRFKQAIDHGRLILAMPAENFVQKRDQALLAFMLISGVRISALLTLQLQHINLERRSIRQYPRVVKTKNSKAMQTAWFPVGDDIEAIFKNWIAGLQAIHKNHSTPLFPRATDPIRRERSLDEIPPLMDQGTVRKIIKRACATVKLPYFNPHAIRRTLALLGNDLCNTAKLRKAWSQNLGHEHVATTDHYYAKLDIDEQLAAFDDIRANVLRHDADELVRLLPQLTAKQIAAITQVARGYTESDVLA
ncbi:site-specific integrase [Brucella sp. 191011898]|uniref:tyrosine-type recombinase/integrase n=1 Tax=Brucella sp. 191011898 TaxID=2730447 RepID=UPI0015DED1B9|nr:site-specific integrase [Brucella sp. 191011898]CAB4327464.1 Tyrosine recombinase XerC [Brucella sp. 191011898]